MDRAGKFNGKKSISLDSLIFLLFNFVVLIDLINGYFINLDLHLPIAQIYKLILIFLLAIRIFSNRFINRIAIFVVIYCLFFIFFYFITEGLDGLFDSVTHLTKLIFIIFSYVYFSRGVKENQIYFFKKMIAFAKISLFFFSVSLVLGRIGFGFSSYSDESSLGSKGYFSAANDLGVALVTLFSFFIYYVSYIDSSRILKFSLFFLLIFLAITVSTKLATLGTIISVLVLPYKSSIKKNLKKNRNKNVITYIFIGVCGVIIASYLITKTPFFARLQNYYQVNDLMFVIFSGRLVYLQNNISLFFNSNLLIQMFGLGGNRTVELDLFDTLFNYGYFGVLVIYYFYGSLITKAYRRSKCILYPYATYVIFIDVLLGFTSFLAGHVLFSAMGGVFISFVNALTFYKNDKSLIKINDQECLPS